MSKVETWVQVYRGPRYPGPDGKPTKRDKGGWNPLVWNADRITKRLDRGIEQQWRRVS